MAHAAPPPERNHKGARIVGSVLVIVAIALAVVAIVSLNRPRGRDAARSTQSGTAGATSGTRSATPSRSSAATSTAATSTATTTTSSSAPRTSTGTSGTTASTGSGTAVGVAKVAIIVANNTGAAGLAEGAANKFEAAGWTVSQWVNFTGDILSTCAYYDPAVTGSEAAAVELQREFPAIKRVKERFDGLPSAPIVVVLTSDYSG